MSGPGLRPRHPTWLPLVHKGQDQWKRSQHSRGLGEPAFDRSQAEERGHWSLSGVATRALLWWPGEGTEPLWGRRESVRALLPAGKQGRGPTHEGFGHMVTRPHVAPYGGGSCPC